MIASAQVAHYARNADRWGVRAGTVSVDLPKVVARKDRVVGRSRAGLNRKVEERPTLHLYHGHARFIGPHVVRVGEERLESERIFIDTGTRPHIPQLEGLGGIDFLDNAGIMRLTEVPAHLIVLGGGYIGVEFGQMFCRFGSRVTVVQRERQIVPHEDADVAEALQ
jgi:pyruvate/2-oxoglutarate dehydrogenase complex dihydrolipoamide dehydrogenase (E3) component